MNDQLGPLLEVDARTGSELVPTLDAYLDAGLSKTAAAAALGIRRQTLYHRLERIGQALAGLDLADRRTAHRRRTSRWSAGACGRRPRRTAGERKSARCAGPRPSASWASRRGDDLAQARG